jgi:tetratricopeptide (TPR) repeat protein
MDEHPRPSALERFLLGRLEREERRRVISHLAKGCELCARQMEHLAHFFRPGRGWEAGLDPGEEAPLEDYDGAVDRAIQAVLLHGEQLPGRRKASRKLSDLLARKGLDSVPLHRYDGWVALEALLERSRELRHDDPREMIYLARHAVLVARRLGAEGFSDEQVHDFRARAEGELGNACRVNDDLPGAERHLARAWRFARRGTGDRQLDLRLRDLEASLLTARHRYPEAIAALDEVKRRNLARGDRHAAGRAMITKALCLSYAGRPDDALAALDEAEALIDPAHEPEILSLAAHNRLSVLADAGRFEAALKVLERHRPLLEQGGRLDRCKLLLYEGRIAAGLGRLGRAENAFRRAREGFAEAGLRGHQALVSLDLATLVLLQGRSPEAHDLSLEALRVFAELEVDDRQEEALLVLAEAIKSELLTVGLLRSVTDFLRRSRHDPNTRYEPRFV